VFDIDQREMLKQRRAAIGAAGLRPNHHLIEADLATSSLKAVLDAAGHRSDVPSFFIAEGLLQYLDPSAAVDLLADIRAAAAPGSQFAFSYLRLDFAQGRALYDAAALYRRFVVDQSLWRLGLDPDAVAPWLATLGWQLTDGAGPAEYQAAT
jgi:methyltransferase (TIGR00027 family)